MLLQCLVLYKTGHAPATRSICTNSHYSFDMYRLPSYLFSMSYTHPRIPPSSSSALWGAGQGRSGRVTGDSGGIPDTLYGAMERAFNTPQNTEINWDPLVKQYDSWMKDISNTLEPALPCFTVCTLICLLSYGTVRRRTHLYECLSQAVSGDLNRTTTTQYFPLPFTNLMVTIRLIRIGDTDWHRDFYNPRLKRTTCLPYPWLITSLNGEIRAEDDSGNPSQAGKNWRMRVRGRATFQVSHYGRSFYVVYGEHQPQIVARSPAFTHDVIGEW